MANSLESLRQWAHAREGNWILWICINGNPRAWRIPWPECDSGRKDAWAQIESVLTAATRDGEIRGKQVGAPRSQTTVIPWPAGPAGTAKDTTASDATEQPAPVIPGLQVKMVSLVLPPRKANAKCAKVILRLLHATQKRHTAADMAIALESDDGVYPWCQAIIEASASWLRKLGAVDNDRDHMGTGYGLVKWDVDPLGDDGE